MQSFLARRSYIVKSWIYKSSCRLRCDEDNDFFFEPERGFSDVFNNSVNQSFVKKDKNIFKLIYIFKNAFRFHYRETKMAQII